jgi:asparagine synthetase B (glutamine-hydrolysing)
MENNGRAGVLIDLRHIKGNVWSYDETKVSQSSGANSTNIDSFLYQGFRHKGAEFLRSIQGRFGAAYHDEGRGVVFLCRDWIGEVPLHYYLTDSSVVVANCISDIQSYIGPEQYRYEYVRVVPQSYALIIDADEQYEYDQRVRKTWHVRERVLYYDFASDPAGSWEEDTNLTLRLTCKSIYSTLEQAVRQRLRSHPRQQSVAVLLSGGIDSLSVAYFLSRIEPKAIAYTLAVGEGGHDVGRAEQIANHFGLKFRKIKVSPKELVDTYHEAVKACELYHIPNVYCAVGMLAIGKALREDGINVAFCGEGVNEALGDYHDWVVKDPSTKQPRVLQRVDHRQLSKTSGRMRYVWGRAHQEGRFNLQLGSGLAKHGVGRMIKPLMASGVDLECPYFDAFLMRLLVGIPHSRLAVVGGKPGLMAKVFEHEIKSGEIPEDFILDSQKIRLQDASEFGEGGLTPVLLKEGFDQQKTSSIYNELFGAHLTPELDAERLSLCSAS